MCCRTEYFFEKNFSITNSQLFSIFLQIQETNKLIFTVLDVQPRVATGGSGKSNDEIVYELAQTNLDRLMTKIDTDNAKLELFEEDDRGRVNSLTTVLTQEIDRYNKLLVVIRVCEQYTFYTFVVTLLLFIRPFEESNIFNWIEFNEYLEIQIIFNFVFLIWLAYFFTEFIGATTKSYQRFRRDVRRIGTSLYGLPEQSCTNLVGECCLPEPEASQFVGEGSPSAVPLY